MQLSARSRDAPTKWSPARSELKDDAENQRGPFVLGLRAWPASWWMTARA